jgi:hypothetical protein
MVCPTPAAHLQVAQMLRGDIESKDWRERGVPCLYCGRAASEVDHYRSAIRNGRGRFIAETPINRVPSCAGCHRAGKDVREDIVAWHALPLEQCSRLHPRRVVGHLKWQRAHTALREWDNFHRSVVRQYVSPHAELFAGVVEAMIQRMYHDQQDDLSALVQSALRFAGGGPTGSAGSGG